MPRPAGCLIPTSHREDAKRLRLVREVYVPQRIGRMLREEGKLMLDFDAAQTPADRLKILDGLMRIRTWIRDSVGWPKPPALRTGRMPAALANTSQASAPGDIAADAVVLVPTPAPPTSGEG